MSGKSKIKQQEIKIQKPAQSLTAFQSKVATGFDERENLLKRVIITGIVLVVIITVPLIWNTWRNSKMLQHEVALQTLVVEVEGSLINPTLATDREEKIRAAMPKLEALADNAPGPSRAVTNGILSMWRLELDGKGAILPTPKDPWARIRMANRHIAIGQAREALDVISPLNKKADPSLAWSQLYWTTLMQIRQLEGNRQQALKDYSEYRKAFKAQADTVAMEKILNGI